MLTVIFATYNGARTLPKTLQALAAVTPPAGGWQVIAVDNGSTDGSAAILANYREHLPLQVISHPVRGKNNALNRALQEPLGELVVFTDDDVVPAADWLLRLEACAGEQPAFDVFGGAIEPYWEIPPARWIVEAVPQGVTYALTDPAQPAGPIYPGLVWGPNMMVRRSVFDAGHRFDAKVGPSAGQYIMGSETEFNIRVGKAGHASWFCPDARVQHIVRDFQMDRAWAIRRAYRFGRNACYQHYREHDEISREAWLAGRLNFPRWMLSRYVADSVGGLAARVLGNEVAAVRKLWDAAFHRGYMAQAQEMLQAASQRRETP